MTYSLSCVTLKINKKTHIPAYIMTCTDMGARKMRNSENDKRAKLNDFDELCAQLEEIQWACEYKSRDELIKKLRSTKRNIEKINKVKEEYLTIAPAESEVDFIASKLKLSKKEIEEVFILEELAKKVSNKTVGTLVNKLSLLDMHSILQEKMTNNLLSYSEAVVINSKIKNNEKLLKEIVDFVVSKGEKRLTKDELRTYITFRLSSEGENQRNMSNLSSFYQFITMKK